MVSHEIYLARFEDGLKKDLISNQLTVLEKYMSPRTEED